MQSRPIRNLMTTLLIFFVHERCACHVMADDVAQYGRDITGDELISTLDRISRQVRQNQESIQTWKGKCEYRDSDYYSNRDNPASSQNSGSDEYKEFQFSDEKIAQARETLESKEGYWYLREGTAEFLLDQQNQKYRVLKQPTDVEYFWDPASGYRHRRFYRSPKTYTVLDAEQAVEFSPDRLLTRIPKPGFEDKIFPKARIAFAMTPREAVYQASLINLLECFASDSSVSFSSPSSRFFSNFAGKIAANLRGQGSERAQALSKEYARLYTTAEEPPVVTLVYGKPGLSLTSSIYQFDGKVGYNVTRYVQTLKGSPNIWRTIKYAEIGEKFVPSELRTGLISAEAESKSTFAHARTLKIETESLNQPIAASEFELVTLGLKYGDRKYDETTKKSYAYDDKLGFVPMGNFDFDPSRSDQGK